MDARIKNGSEMLIAGMSEHYQHGDDPRIAAQWAQFMDAAARIPGRVGDETYGVVANAEDGFDYTAGIQVDPNANVAGFSQVRLAKRRYAVFTHSGDVSAIPKTMDRIWRDWLPGSGETIAKAPFFERYDDRFDPSTGRGDVEIWVPLEN